MPGHKHEERLIEYNSGYGRLVYIADDHANEQADESDVTRDSACL